MKYRLTEVITWNYLVLFIGFGFNVSWECCKFRLWCRLQVAIHYAMASGYEIKWVRRLRNGPNCGDNIRILDEYIRTWKYARIVFGSRYCLTVCYDLFVSSEDVKTCLDYVFHLIEELGFSSVWGFVYLVWLRCSTKSRLDASTLRILWFLIQAIFNCFPSTFQRCMPCASEAPRWGLNKNIFH